MEAPLLFISHGAAMDTMDVESSFAQELSKIGALIQDKVKNVLVLSPHFYTNDKFIHISTGDSTSKIFSTLHDHPFEAIYDFEYPAKSDSDLGEKVSNLLQSFGIKVAITDHGLDHGAWIALNAVFPDVPNFPIVQVSIPNLDEHGYFRLGETLKPLRPEGTLIICSGGVTHNQKEYLKSFIKSFPNFESVNDNSASARRKRRDVCLNNQPEDWALEFDNWVSSLVADHKNHRLLLDWRKIAPFPEKNHPEPSHFVPLLIACGAANGDSVRKIHSGFNHSMSSSCYIFESAK